MQLVWQLPDTTEKKYFILLMNSDLDLIGRGLIGRGLIGRGLIGCGLKATHGMVFLEGGNY